MNKIKLFFKRLYIKYKLNKGFKSNKIVLVKNKHRGIGKTTMLVELSKKYNIPIVVSNKMQADMFNKEFMYDHTFWEKIFYSYSTDDLRKPRFKNGVFVDETISVEQINSLCSVGIQVKTGFYYNDLLL